MTLTLHLRLFTVSEGPGVNPAMGRPDLSFEISDSASFRGQYLSILEESFFDPKRPHRRLLSEPEHVMCVFLLCELQTTREYVEN